MNQYFKRSFAILLIFTISNNLTTALKANDDSLLPVDPEDQIYGVKSRLIEKKERISTSLSYGFTANDEFLVSHNTKIDLGYYVMEDLEIFLSGIYCISNQRTFNYDKAISLVSQDKSLSPLVAELKYALSIGARYSLIYGKVKGLFGKLWYLDSYLAIAPTILETESFGNYRSPSNKNGGQKFGGLGQIGLRFLTTQHLNWGLNVSLLVYNESYEADNGFYGSANAKTVKEMRKLLHPELFVGWIF